MMIVEKSFPRGGTVQPSAEKKPFDPAQEKITFGAFQRSNKKKHKPRKHDKFISALEGTKEEDGIKTISAELLSYQTIQDGMVIMGIVKSVDQLYLSISLPGRMTARVSALEISDSYTKATRELLKNTEPAENYKSLQDLYHVGQIVYGLVQEVTERIRGRTDINLTLRPAEVHRELVHTNVRKGFIFNGAIEEVQEHGYIIESGIKGLRTFLPLAKKQPAHCVGELIYLKVEKITYDKAASTCSCKEIQADKLQIKNITDPNIDYILPSAVVQFSVSKLLKDGLQGTIMDGAFTAYINEHQLAEALALPEDYKVLSNLKARVLYVMPLTKLVYLSLNLHNSVGGGATDALTPAFKRGDVIENAKVHRLGTGGVVLVLKNKFKGIISYKTIKTNYKGNYDQDELLTKYAKKTTHKVRVLDYDLMDSLYICTDDANVVNEKMFTLTDLEAGEFVTAVVKERSEKFDGYTLQVGKLKGIIEKMYLSPTTKTLELNSKIRCRVVAVNMDRKVVYLTNHPEYMSKTVQVLTSLTDARTNAIYTGTIVRSTEVYILVSFFNNLKGILYKKSLRGLLSSELNTFHDGQTTQFRIEAKNDEQIKLGLPEDTFSMGTICPVSVTNSSVSGLEIKIVTNADTESATEMNALIPVRLLSDYGDLLQAKLRMFPVDAQLQAACIVKNIFSLRDVQYFQNQLTKDWHSVQSGDILKAVVKNVTEDVVEVMVPVRGYGKLVKVHLKMLLVHAFDNANLVLVPDQVIYVKVLSKELQTRTLTISAKLVDVWDSDFGSTAQYLNSYLKENTEIKKAYKKLGKPIAKYAVGDKISALFQGVHADTNDWQYQVAGTEVQAIAKFSVVGNSKPPKVGKAQFCVILWIDYSKEVLFVTNQSKDMDHVQKSKTISPNLVGKSGLNAKVIFKNDNVFICSLKKGENPLIYCPVRLHFNDFESSASFNIKEGEFCKLTFIHDDKPIAVLEKTWKLWISKKKKRKIEDEKVGVVKSKKPKLEEVVVKLEEPKAVPESQLSKNLKRKKAEKVEIEPVSPKKTNIKQEEVPKCALFYEDKTPETPEVRSAREKLQARNYNGIPVKSLPGITDFWSTDLMQLNESANGAVSSDEDDDTTNVSLQKKKKLSSGEKFKQQREEEERLRAIESKNADPTQLPETVDQFDRLVLSDPNNSKHWINYMVLHLQSTEIDKARAVAQRAIKAISFRSDDEQLNIWVAWLNLELRYGTKETFDETLKQALTYNDPLKIYLRTVEILGAANKQQELIEIVGIITKKFKAHQDVWKAAANAYFSIGMAERAQQMLHRALASLPERDHVNTIVMFANLHHRHGNNEMAQTLMDQIVTSYPKRVDVWTQYVDMLAKEDLIVPARAVLERAVIQTIPLKKMRTIFKKYLEFEERFGTETDVEKVKHLAMEYVKKNASL